MSGFTTTGAKRRSSTSRRCPAFAAALAPVHAVARRHRDHRARARGPAAAARRRPPAARARDARPEFESLPHAIRETARRVWILYVGLTVALVAILLGLGWSGLDERDDALRSSRARVHDDPDRRLLDAGAARSRRFAAATQWVVVRFMILAGTNFALLFRAIVRRQPRAVARDEEFRLYVALLVARVAPRSSPRS